MVPFIRDYNQTILIPQLNDFIKPWYIIDTQCNIFSLRSNKYLEPQMSENGYLTVHLTTEYGTVVRKIHRLCMMSFLWFPGCDQYQVNHKDGIKTHNWIGNLEWCLPSYNIHHAIENNLRIPFKGEFNHNSKITEETAKNIIALLLEGKSDTYISELLNVPVSIIQEIARGNTWTYLTKDIIDQLKSTRRGYGVTNKQYHHICLYFQNNINKYDGFGKVKRICEDALSSVGLPINDRFMRIAKRLFYKYDKHEITSIYKY